MKEKHQNIHFNLGKRQLLFDFFLHLRRGDQRKSNNNNEAMARRFGRASFTRAAAILSCACWTAVLAAPSFSQASPIAILPKGDDRGDAFIKVVGVLCENRVDEEGRDEQNLCRHFEDEREVSSLLMQNAEAFAAIVTEARGVVSKNCYDSFVLHAEASSFEKRTRRGLADDPKCLFPPSFLVFLCLLTS